MTSWRDEIARPVCRLEVGGFRPTGRPEASSFGRVILRNPDEAWPTWRGEPLLPICQLNLAEAPFRPGALQDLSLLTIFVSENFHDGDELIVRNRRDKTESFWCLRSYESLEGLVPYDAPPASLSKSLEARWRAPETDFPTHDTMPIELPPEIEESYYDIEGIRTLEGTKLGGWPSCIQSEPWWGYREGGDEFEYCLQVDSERKAEWSWGDAGAAYFARSKSDPDRWAFDWQCL